MAALFGNTTQRRGGKKNLLEFKAGKMYLQGKMCHADKRKGTVFIHQTDDSLMHFCWKDRTTGKIEEDLLILPDDTEFKKVPQCTTGRVYVLKFKSATKKIFWMQEPKTDKDEENCKKVNDLLNNPPTPGSNRGGGFGSSSAGLPDLQPSELANLGDSDLSSLLGGMSQEQLLRLIGGVGSLGGGGSTAAGLTNALRGVGRPSSTQSQESSTPVRVQSAPEAQPSSAEEPVTPQPRPVTAAALPGGPPPADSRAGAQSIQLSDLQSVLSNIQVPAAAEESHQAINLAEALSAEKMIPILADPGVQERLTPFLPQNTSVPSSEAELRSTVSSPQFQQALTSFSSALASGQLGPVLAQFGLDAAAVEAANRGDVQGFVTAMQDGESKGEKMDES